VINVPNDPIDYVFYDGPSRDIDVNAPSLDGKVIPLGDLDDIIGLRGSGGSTETLLVPRQSISVDGDVGELSDPSSLSVADDFAVFRGSSDSIGGDVWYTWDDSNFYLAAALDDDDHSQDRSAGELYRGDSLQLGIAPGEPGSHTDQFDFTEFTFGLTTDGPEIYRRDLHDDTSGVASDATLDIVRDDGLSKTTYELALPWSALRSDPSEEFLSLAAAIIEYDGGEETGLLQWGQGIFGGKDVRGFNRATLVE